MVNEILIWFHIEPFGLSKILHIRRRIFFTMNFKRVFFCNQIVFLFNIYTLKSVHI